MKAFVERQSIARFIEQIKIETDPVKYELLTKLLAEEEEKQRGAKDGGHTGFLIPLAVRTFV